MALKEASTCRSKDSKGKCIERTYDYVVACYSLRRNISQMKVVEDFESRPHKAVSFVVERDKEIQELKRQKLPKVLPGYSGGRLPGRSTKEAGREEEEKKEDSREGRIRNGIDQKVVAGIKEKANTHEDAKSTALGTAGQRVKQYWDCSQIENEEEEEEEDWQEGDQMGVRWAGDEKFLETLERRRMEGTSLQAEVMQKARELVVHEWMFQGKKREAQKKRRTLKGGPPKRGKTSQAVRWRKTPQK